jgi:hypothetical protein
MLLERILESLARMMALLMGSGFHDLTSLGLYSSVHVEIQALTRTLIPRRSSAQPLKSRPYLGPLMAVVTTLNPVGSQTPKRYIWLVSKEMAPYDNEFAAAETMFVVQWLGGYVELTKNREFELK